MFFGTLLHFCYELSNDNILVALFSPVNESIWEHLKLLFFPSIFTLILANILNINDGNYLLVKLKGIIIGLLFIIVFYYTYTGILGFSITILDILSFYISCIISYIYTKKHYNKYATYNKFILYLIILLISIIFIIFTFIPIHINLFIDPVTNKYGIIK
jgi:hypothetical protein